MSIDTILTNDFNILNKFLAFHNFQEDKHYDVILVLGSATPIVALKSYELYKKGYSDYFMIAGGIGHTTDILLNHVEPFLKDTLSNKSEAYILKRLIESTFYVNGEDIILEEQSTNCGENIQFAFDILREKQIKYDNVLLCHDPLMQRRIDATAKKYMQNINFDNYCAFIPKIKVENYNVLYDQNIWGLWPTNRYISLVLGEMKRVIDNEDGYGPKGKNFIVHVDVTKEVLLAYNNLLKNYRHCLRE